MSDFPEKTNSEMKRRALTKDPLNRLKTTRNCYTPNSKETKKKEKPAAEKPLKEKLHKPNDL
jgi:hypothetical protein